MADVTMPAARETKFLRINRAVGAAALSWPKTVSWHSVEPGLMSIAKLEYGVVPALPTQGSGLTAPTWKLEGHVYLRDEEGNDNPVGGAEVVLFVRGNKRPIDRTFSRASDGYYGFFGLPPGAQHFAVAFDSDGTLLQNAVILDKLVPVAP